MFQQPSGGWCFGFKIVRSIFKGSEHDGRGHAGCQFLGVFIEFFTEFHHVHAKWSQRLADGGGGLRLTGQDTKSGNAFDGGCRHCGMGEVVVVVVVRRLSGTQDLFLSGSCLSLSGNTFFWSGSTSFVRELLIFVRTINDLNGSVAPNPIVIVVCGWSDDDELRASDRTTKPPKTGGTK